MRDRVVEINVRPMALCWHCVQSTRRTSVGWFLLLLFIFCSVFLERLLFTEMYPTRESLERLSWYSSVFQIIPVLFHSSRPLNALISNLRIEGGQRVDDFCDCGIALQVWMLSMEEHFVYHVLCYGDTACSIDYFFISPINKLLGNAPVYSAHLIGHFVSLRFSFLLFLEFPWDIFFSLPILFEYYMAWVSAFSNFPIRKFPKRETSRFVHLQSCRHCPTNNPKVTLNRQLFPRCTNLFWYAFFLLKQRKKFLYVNRSPFNPSRGTGKKERHSVSAAHLGFFNCVCLYTHNIQNMLSVWKGRRPALFFNQGTDIQLHSRQGLLLFGWVKWYVRACRRMLVLRLLLGPRWRARTRQGQRKERERDPKRIRDGHFPFLGLSCIFGGPAYSWLIGEVLYR